MFRITEDPSSGSLVQCLAKNYKNDSILSIDVLMDMIESLQEWFYVSIDMSTDMIESFL